ncbi:MAG: TRAP transporter small permease subunit [Beijerinckiaceae bacterium]
MDTIRESANSPPGGDRADSLFGYTVAALNAAGSLLIVALVVLINVEAFSRSFLNRPFEGVIELIEIGIVGIVFLQLADATRKKILTQSDGLFNTLMDRSPAAGRLFGVVINLLGALFMALILYGSWPLLTEAWTEGHYVGVQHVFTAPAWPVKLIIVVGSLFTLIQFLLFTASYLRPAPGARHPNGGG